MTPMEELNNRFRSMIDLLRVGVPTRMCAALGIGLPKAVSLEGSVRAAKKERLGGAVVWSLYWLLEVSISVLSYMLALGISRPWDAESVSSIVILLDIRLSKTR